MYIFIRLFRVVGDGALPGRIAGPITKLSDRCRDRVVLDLHYAIIYSFEHFVSFKAVLSFRLLFTEFCENVSMTYFVFYVFLTCW